MSLPHALLGVLTARPLNGYELVQFFSDHYQWVWSAQRSQIYPTLHKMQDSGWVTGEHQIKGERMQKTVYSITDAGQHALHDWVAQTCEWGSPREAVFLQALNFDVIEPHEAIVVLDRVIAEQQTMIVGWEAHAEKLRRHDTQLLRARLESRPELDADRVAAVKVFAFEGLIAQARARIEWAESGRHLFARLDTS